MTTRTTSRIMTFPRSFRLSGMESEQPAGRYLVETDEELLEDLSFPVYQRMATYLTLPRRAHGVISSEMVRVDPAELEAAAGSHEPALLPGRELGERWPSRAQTSSAARGVASSFSVAIHRDRE